MSMKRDRSDSGSPPINRRKRRIEAGAKEGVARAACTSSGRTASRGPIVEDSDEEDEAGTTLGSDEGFDESLCKSIFKIIADEGGESDSGAETAESDDERLDDESGGDGSGGDESLEDEEEGSRTEEEEDDEEEGSLEDEGTDVTPEDGEEEQIQEAASSSELDSDIDSNASTSSREARRQRYQNRLIQAPLVTKPKPRCTTSSPIHPSTAAPRVRLRQQHHSVFKAGLPPMLERQRRFQQHLDAVAASASRGAALPTNTAQHVDPHALRERMLTAVRGPRVVRSRRREDEDEEEHEEEQEEEYSDAEHEDGEEEDCEDERELEVDEDHEHRSGTESGEDIGKESSTASSSEEEDPSAIPPSAQRPPKSSRKRR